MAFDPLNLLLLAIAIVVFWRLRSVLGIRTGNERPPVEPYNPSGNRDPKTEEEAGKILRFPKDELPAEGTVKGDDEPALPILTGFATAGSPAAIGIEQISKADKNFTPKAFVEGAKLAYEMIIDAFARGDRAQLKNLLSRDVFDGFSRAIETRETAGQKSESRFVGIDSSTILAAGTIARKASITMRFESELISVTYAKDGTIADGDPNQIVKNTDVWTFERDLGARDPNWKLASTEEPA